MNWIKNIFDELKHIKSGKKECRDFGLTIGVILVILGGIAVWRHKAVYPYFFESGLLLIIPGMFFPMALKPLQKIWMGAAVIIGFFMSRVILGVLFYTVITPMGLIIRTLGKDILDERIEKNRASYWIPRSGEKSKESYENQY